VIVRWVDKLEEGFRFDESIEFSRILGLEFLESVLHAMGLASGIHLDVRRDAGIDLVHLEKTRKRSVCTARAFAGLKAEARHEFFSKVWRGPCVNM
jgi:hypothetical protein